MRRAARICDLAWQLVDLDDDGHELPREAVMLLVNLVLPELMPTVEPVREAGSLVHTLYQHLLGAEFVVPKPMFKRFKTPHGLKPGTPLRVTSTSPVSARDVEAMILDRPDNTIYTVSGSWVESAILLATPARPAHQFPAEE